MNRCGRDGAAGNSGTSTNVIIGSAGFADAIARAAAPASTGRASHALASVLNTGSRAMRPRCSQPPIMTTCSNSDTSTAVSRWSL